MASKIVNLTSHPVHIFNPSKEPVATIAPSGTVCRAIERYQTVHTQSGITFFSAWSEGVVGLPPKRKGVIYVVSNRAAEAINKNRRDVYQAGRILRSKRGHILGCFGLMQKKRY